MTGYTPKEAARIKYQIALDVAKIVDAAAKLRRRVTDVSDFSQAVGDIDRLLEEFREVQYALEAIVDRRTRQGSV